MLLWGQHAELILCTFNCLFWNSCCYFSRGLQLTLQLCNLGFSPTFSNWNSMLGLFPCGPHNKVLPFQRMHDVSLKFLGTNYPIAIGSIVALLYTSNVIHQLVTLKSYSLACCLTCSLKLIPQCHWNAAVLSTCECSSSRDAPLHSSSIASFSRPEHCIFDTTPWMFGELRSSSLPGFSPAASRRLCYFCS